MACLDLAATAKTRCGTVVAGLHLFFSLENWYICCAGHTQVKCFGMLFINDDEFIGRYFLGISMTRVTDTESTTTTTTFLEETVDGKVVSIADDGISMTRLTDPESTTTTATFLEETVDGKVASIADALRAPSLTARETNVKADCKIPADIIYSDLYGGSLDEMLPVGLVIHTRRTQYEFGKETKRHEMHDVFTYRCTSSQCIKIEKTADLFKEETETNGETPRKILVVGRAGIGKTMLTRKIQYDWANDISEVYRGKILFYFQLRWFNIEAWHNMTVKEFLRHGTEHFSRNSNFETIFQEILEDPTKAVLIFDGLDESNVNLNDLKTAGSVQNDDSSALSSTDIFLKLSMGNLLDGATVVITGRPNASEVYLKLRFDRQVEILGFTRSKIEQYVEKYCKNNNVPDLKEKIWNHIKTSDDLLSMCYIPMNCFVVCVSLRQSLTTHAEEDKVLPESLTELYHEALLYFTEAHERRVPYDVGRLAFQGVANKQLIFNSEEIDKSIENFGLLQRLPNAIFPIHVQFCFLHLSLQEFLAALHITRTYGVYKIEDFVAKNCNDGNWHLVIQFVAGILGNSRTYMDRHIPLSNTRFGKSFCSHVIFGPHVPREFFLDELSKKNKNVGVLMMKCLQEIEDEEFVKSLASEMVLPDDNMIICSDLYPADWKAIDGFLKHMMNRVKGGKLLF